VSHKGVHPPCRDLDLSCRCRSCRSCCCRLVDVAEHAAADRVPSATGAVVADVGIPRCHGRGRTTCWFSDKNLAASSRSTMGMWSFLLWPTTDRATSLTATCTDVSVIVPVDPGSLGRATTGRQCASLPISNPLPSCRSSCPRGRCCDRRATRPARNLASLARLCRYGGTLNWRWKVTPSNSKELEFKFVYIFSLRQAIHGLQTKGTDDTCILPIKSLSSGPQVAVKVAQGRWQAIDNKKL
jgi:hypothetical protein